MDPIITPATERGNWIVTYTGERFFPMDPRPEEISIQDVAHALSNICRFGGHVSKFYSVAQHSVLAAMKTSAAGNQVALWALLHDASEAYLGDMVKPLKNSMPAFEAVEAKVMLAVTKRFGLDPVEPPEVKAIDRQLCVTEARDLVGLNRWWNPWKDVEPLHETIKPRAPDVAEEEFLIMFNYLYRG